MFGVHLWAQGRISEGVGAPADQHCGVGIRAARNMDLSLAFFHL
jgi:hypothetical protein